MPVIGVQRDFFKKFKYVVEIAGVRWAGFTTCSELRQQVAVVEQWEGGSLTADKQPGRITYPNVTLGRGATQDKDLYLWAAQVAAADAMVANPDHIRSVDIVQQDRRGQELERWSLVEAWPTEFKAGEWDNGADENTMEELVLCYRFFTRRTA